VKGLRLKMLTGNSRAIW